MKSDFESMKFQELHFPGIRGTQCVFHVVSKRKALKYGHKSDRWYRGKMAKPAWADWGEWHGRWSVWFPVRLCPQEWGILCKNINAEQFSDSEPLVFGSYHPVSFSSFKNSCIELLPVYRKLHTFKVSQLTSPDTCMHLGNHHQNQGHKDTVGSFSSTFCLFGYECPFV